MKTSTVFYDGDRIQVLPLDYLKERLRGARGVIIAWAHDDLYHVQLDGLPAESVLEAQSQQQCCREFRNHLRELSPLRTLVKWH